MRIDYGEPFVGKAGKLMNMAFQTLGIKREEVYIANIVKCRPPANRNLFYNKFINYSILLTTCLILLKLAANL